MLYCVSGKNGGFPYSMHRLGERVPPCFFDIRNYCRVVVRYHDTRELDVMYGILMQNKWQLFPEY